MKKIKLTKSNCYPWDKCNSEEKIFRLHLVLEQLVKEVYKNRKKPLIDTSILLERE